MWTQVLMLAEQAGIHTHFHNLHLALSLVKSFWHYFFKPMPSKIQLLLQAHKSDYSLWIAYHLSQKGFLGFFLPHSSKLGSSTLSSPVFILITTLQHLQNDHLPIYKLYQTVKSWQVGRLKAFILPFPMPVVGNSSDALAENLHVNTEDTIPQSVLD